jgi:cobalt-precorrin 5A hydrolase
MSLGIGCKKGTEKEKIENLAAGTLEKAGIFPQAIARVASIDLKKEEKGLLGFCKAHDLPLKIYSCEELKGAKGTFSSSPFVSRITGVDNVCERSAHLAAGKGRLLIKKQASEGVTIACAVEDWSVNFE